MIFVYSVSYNYDYEDNYRYECFLLTTNKRGKLIDRQQIAKEYDQEDQSSHYNTVILNDSTYRVFNYNINEKYAVQKNGSYEVIDENEPQTKVTIVEYRIKNDGHITKSGYKDVRYAPKWVLYYERYSKTNMVSDDPMNEY